jgi:hypothetical protein
MLDMAVDMMERETGRVRHFALKKHRAGRAQELELNTVTVLQEQEMLKMLSSLDGGSTLLLAGFA